MAELTPTERSVLLTALDYFQRHARKLAENPLAPHDYAAHADQACALALRIRTGGKLSFEEGPEPSPASEPPSASRS